MLIPFRLREWMGHTDIATIPSLSGASISSPEGALLSLWREYATDQGWVAGYIQLAAAVDVSWSLPKDELWAGNRVLLLDLDDPEILESASASIRQKIKQAEASGAVLIEDRDVVAESLTRLYPVTMQRVGARSDYEYSEQTLERWAQDAGSVALGARIGDSVEAVSMFSVAGTHAEYHLNASSDDGRELAAWLIANAIPRLREGGVRMFNLGGGVRPGDGVYRFKERFNGEPHELLALRQIYDPQTYARLCQRAGVDSDVAWFPAYRAAGR